MIKQITNTQFRHLFNRQNKDKSKCIFIFILHLIYYQYLALDSTQIVYCSTIHFNVATSNNSDFSDQPFAFPLNALYSCAPQVWCLQLIKNAQVHENKLEFLTYTNLLMSWFVYLIWMKPQIPVIQILNLSATQSLFFDKVDLTKITRNYTICSSGNLE